MENTVDFKLEKAKKNVMEKSKLEGLWDLSEEEIDTFHQDMEYIARNMNEKDLLEFLDSIGE